MPEEIHVTVPKGAKVIIHEVDENGEEQVVTLRDLLDALNRLIAIEQTRPVPMIPFPVIQQPIYIVPTPVEPPKPHWTWNPPIFGDTRTFPISINTGGSNLVVS